MNAAHEAQAAILENLRSMFLEIGLGMMRQHWPILLVLIAISLLARVLRNPRLKGRVGEAMVSVGALRKLDKQRYRVFNDLVLPRPDGKRTTQIDHVVASPYGIFVIETKNYRGRIFGDPKARYWTQVLPGRKNRFQNPLHQNALHINALVKATGLPKDHFKNLVHFVGDVVLKTELPPEVMTKGMLSYIRSHQAELVSFDELAAVVSVLDGWRAQAKEGRRDHQRQMR